MYSSFNAYSAIIDTARVKQSFDRLTSKGKEEYDFPLGYAGVLGLTYDLNKLWQFEVNIGASYLSVDNFFKYVYSVTGAQGNEYYQILISDTKGNPINYHEFLVINFNYVNYKIYSNNGFNVYFGIGLPVLHQVYYELKIQNTDYFSQTNKPTTSVFISAKFKFEYFFTEKIFLLTDLYAATNLFTTPPNVYNKDVSNSFSRGNIMQQIFGLGLGFGYKFI